MRGNELIPGDIVLAINGVPVGSLAQLQTVLDRHQPGSVDMVSLWRRGRVAEVQVELS